MHRNTVCRALQQLFEAPVEADDTIARVLGSEADPLFQKGIGFYE